MSGDVAPEASGAASARADGAVAAPADGPDPRDLRFASQYGMLLRTPELPMAFTFGEFARGAGLALAGFQLLFPLVYAVMGGVSSLLSPGFGGAGSAFGMALITGLYAFGFALPWSIGALVLAGGPAAWLLGWSLRRVRRMAWHLAAFAALGVVVGAATALVASASMTPGSGPQPYFALMAAPVTALAVALGWWRTATWALRDDVAYRRGLGIGGDGRPRHP